MRDRLIEAVLAQPGQHQGCRKCRGVAESIVDGLLPVIEDEIANAHRREAA